MTLRLSLSRQMIVAEVGEDGQSRLEAATAALDGDGLAHAIAREYAARAGVGTIVAGAFDESRLAPSFVENSAARSVVAGSRAALAAMRAVLLPGTVGR